jgi:hypothetical protein
MQPFRVVWKRGTPVITDRRSSSWRLLCPVVGESEVGTLVSADEAAGRVIGSDGLANQKSNPPTIDQSHTGLDKGARFNPYSTSSPGFGDGGEISRPYPQGRCLSI